MLEKSPPESLRDKKAYEPGTVEEKWYARWLEAGAFTADPASEKPAFSMVIPPPNVTGVLHLGHVLNNTMQDILCRHARMTGHEVLWLPGTDHAGIATQSVVERKLRQEGTTRQELGREEFLKRIWEWKEKHGGIIIRQLKRLGCSCDWSRERFTMDSDYSREVLRGFVELYREGLIYRGKRMVNWCPVSRTALSDEEVIMKPQKGLLYHFRVEVAEAPGTFLIIATTRPETIPGDTAVAVNPKDERYASLIGQHVIRPLPPESEKARKLIPIIGDPQVDSQFGTGVLKVTPAHDKTDFEIGQRHHLPLVEVMQADGVMNAHAGWDLEGLDRFAARQRAVELLKEQGAMLKEEPYDHAVGFSERADVPVEPRLSEQWFLRYPQAKEAFAAVQTGEIQIVPERWANVYTHWMENLQDWCISRQLWWGHRIPAWYRKPSGTEDASNEQPQIYVGTEPPPDAENWEQDADVLDTWFSSWLWPFATMDVATLAKFYPTTVLSTGFDILFFWVARMIMAGYRFTGQKPFSHVIIHNLVRDIEGRKMSKSLGNSPDPLDLIEKYGADGLRYGLMRIAPQGQDIRFDEKQIEEGRNFANKLWNAARFRMMQGNRIEGLDLGGLVLSVYSLDILAKLDGLVEKIEGAYAGFRFHEISQSLYEFFWSDYCDWYVEAAKTEIQSENPVTKESALAVMDHVLRRLLLLLHPVMPHLTEELWEQLGYGDAQSDPRGLDYQAFPRATQLAGIERARITSAQARAAALYRAVHAARNLRAEYRVPSNRKVRFILQSAPDWVASEIAVFARLTSAEEVRIDPLYQPERGVPRLLTELGEIYLPLEGLIDVEQESERLRKEIEKIEEELRKVRKKLENEQFVTNAPGEVVAEHRTRETDWQAKLVQLKQMREALGA